MFRKKSPRGDPTPTEETQATPAGPNVKEGYIAVVRNSISTGPVVYFLDPNTHTPEGEPYVLSLLFKDIDHHFVKAGTKGIKVSVEWEWAERRGMKEIRSYELLLSHK